MGMCSQRVDSITKIKAAVLKCRGSNYEDVVTILVRRGKRLGDIKGLCNINKYFRLKGEVENRDSWRKC